MTNSETNPLPTKLIKRSDVLRVIGTYDIRIAVSDMHILMFEQNGDISFHRLTPTLDFIYVYDSIDLW